MVMTICIGMITPPVGMAMFMVCSIADIDMGTFTKSVLPFLIALIVAVITVSFIPSLILFLPNLLMGHERVVYRLVAACSLKK